MGNVSAGENSKVRKFCSFPAPILWTLLLIMCSLTKFKSFVVLLNVVRLTFVRVLNFWKLIILVIKNIHLNRPHKTTIVSAPNHHKFSFGNLI